MLLVMPVQLGTPVTAGTTCVNPLVVHVASTWLFAVSVLRPVGFRLSMGSLYDPNVVPLPWPRTDITSAIVGVNPYPGPPQPEPTQPMPPLAPLDPCNCQPWTAPPFKT